MLADMDYSDPSSLGEEIKRRRLLKDLSVDKASAGAGINRTTWNRIEAGQSTQETKRAAAMRFLGMLDDRAPLTAQAGEDAAKIAAHDLNDALADFTDAELARELEARALYYATLLDARGEPSLTWGVDPAGMRALRSIPGGRRNQADSSPSS